jgi:hypothetical protein
VAIRQREKYIDNVHQEKLFIDPVFPICSPNNWRALSRGAEQKIESIGFANKKIYSRRSCLT